MENFKNTTDFEALDLDLDLDQYDLTENEQDNEEENVQLDDEPNNDDAEVLSELSDLFEEDEHLLQLAVDTRELTLNDVPFDRDLKYINVAGGSGQVDEKAMRLVRKLVLTEGDEKANGRRRRDRPHKPKKETADDGISSRRRRGHAVEIDESSSKGHEEGADRSSRRRRNGLEGRGKRENEKEKDDKLWRPKLMVRPPRNPAESSSGVVDDLGVKDNDTDELKEIIRQRLNEKPHSLRPIQKVSQPRARASPGLSGSSEPYVPTGAIDTSSATVFGRMRPPFNSKQSNSTVEYEQGADHVYYPQEAYDSGTSGQRGHGHRSSRGRGRGAGRHRGDKHLQQSEDTQYYSQEHLNYVHPTEAYSSTNYSKKQNHMHNRRNFYADSDSSAGYVQEQKFVQQSDSGFADINDYMDPNQQLRVTAPEFTPSFLSKPNSQANTSAAPSYTNKGQSSKTSAEEFTPSYLGQPNPSAPEFVPSFLLKGSS